MADSTLRGKMVYSTIWRCEISSTIKFYENVDEIWQVAQEEEDAHIWPDKNV